MKTAAIVLKILFVLLLVITVALAAFQLRQARYQAADPAFRQPASAAPSVYAYARPGAQ
ncbi:hypothetical protein [Hymenobacter norwichensis]|uniref:hypothetical protein n=1 Tax=Hymenobacter norwichensis TaxID=223903 RepID=UPI0003B4CD8A|nr:hypothetical protein [Hymenobacter norwichensis]